MDYGIKCKTIKLLEKRGENLWELKLDKMFFTLKEWFIKRNIDKLDSIQIKTFCSVEDPI